MCIYIYIYTHISIYTHTYGLHAETERKMAAGAQATMSWTTPIYYINSSNNSYSINSSNDSYSTNNSNNSYSTMSWTTPRNALRIEAIVCMNDICQDYKFA